MQYILKEKVIKIKKIIKPIKGGSSTMYIIISAVGDCNGGIGLGKAKSFDQNFAIYRSFYNARKNFIKVALKNNTIYHEIYGSCGASKVILIPSKTGYGILAGSCIRYILEVTGIKSIITKIYGSNNSWNVSKAAFNALINLKCPYYISQKRGKFLKSLFN